MGSMLACRGKTDADRDVEGTTGDQELALLKFQLLELEGGIGPVGLKVEQ
jgi:hypothetical protein